MTLYFININGELYKDDYAITPEMIEALARQGWNRIGRAKWRQLKREQKKAQKESELALQYADTTEHHNWVMGT